MFKVVLFFKYDYSYVTKQFDTLQHAEEYCTLMTHEMRHEECPISSIQLFDSNNQKIREY